MECPHCHEDAPDTNYKCPHCRQVLRKGVQPGDFVHQPQEVKKSMGLTYTLLTVMVVGIGFIAYAVMQRNSESNTAVNGPTATMTQQQLPAGRAQSVNADAPAVDQAAAEIPADDDSGFNQPLDESEGTTEETDNSEDLSMSNDDGDGENDGAEPGTSTEAAGNAAAAGAVTTLTAGEEVNIERLVVRGQTTIFDFYSDFCPPCRSISPLLEALDSRRSDIVVIKMDINRKGVQGIDWTSPLAQQFKLSSIPHFIIYDSDGNRSHEGMSARQQVQTLLYNEGLISN